jgi:UDP-N-acetylmuramyl pentapeptide phosphotransferase/UDP-N-acetylglucosamine-1-phosphate transferase
MIFNFIVSISITIIIYLIFIYLTKHLKIKAFKIINDSDFKKPQSFHEDNTPRIGGLILLAITIALYFFNYSSTQNLNDIYFFLSFFLIGFADDIKIITKPSIRLLLIISVILLNVIYLDIHINNLGFNFLNYLIDLDIILKIILTSICILTVLNGCNFIDGFNGLLIIQSIIISLLILLADQHNLITNNLKYLILGLACVLMLNFPKAKIFMGDSGSYLIGSIISLNIIKTSNLNNGISPFFYATLLFYIFSEVFISFFRKILIEKKNPLKPDGKHFHMLVFQKINEKLNNTQTSNFMTSIVINLCFLIIISPIIILKNNFQATRLVFFGAVIIYIILYAILYKKKN